MTEKKYIKTCVKEDKLTKNVQDALELARSFA
jgi:hypothetical protein